MTHRYVHFLSCAALISAALFAQNGGQFTQTNLISDKPGLAPITDTNLVNPWGIASTATGPWWLSGDGTDLAIVVTGAGTPFPANNPLKVHIPSPSGMGPALPTGVVANPTPDFLLAPSQPAVFLFASIRGTISGWNQNVDPGNAVIKVTTPGAVYTGLTLGQLAGQNVIYAANFAGGMDVFDAGFNPITTALPSGAFQDPEVPTGYAPYNVENIGGSIFVMFAKQGEEEAEPGPGFGFVDQFTPDGKLLLRFEHGDWMNAPWGITMAPPGFGSMTQRLLVGQFGSGQIASFNRENGKFEGLMLGTDKQPIAIEGIWGIRFGNDANAGSSRELFFAAGIDDENHGLLGKLTPATGNSGQMMMSDRSAASHR